MKKALSLVLSLIMILSCLVCTTAFAQDDIKITINGQNLEMDQKPIMINDRTLVPVRAIFEALGAKVSWDDPSQTAIGVKNGKEIKITIENTTAYVDGKAITLDVPAKLINDRTLVPVRFISESLGATVSWNDATQTVIITSENQRKIVFDDLDKFENNKDFICGAAYDPKNVSLSNDFDHTTGSGKSLKLANRQNTNHRLKIKNMFRDDDIGKIFTISAWVYSPEQNGSITMGTYSDVNTKYAMEPTVSTNEAVTSKTWTEIKIVYKHEDKIITQLGFEQKSGARIDNFYIDDIKIIEKGDESELSKPIVLPSEKPPVEVEKVVDGKRPVPTEFKTGKDYDDLIYFGLGESSPKELLEKLPQGTTVVGENFVVDALKIKENAEFIDCKSGKMEAINVDGMSFDKAVRVNVYEPIDPAYEYQLSLGIPLEGKANDGDVCLLRLHMRTVEGGASEAQMGQIQVVIEENGGVYAKTLATNVTNGSEWKEFYFPFVFKSNYTHATIRLAYYKQIVEFGGYNITNYGKDVSIDDLPTDANSSPFLAPDASWRKDAWERIEDIRKGDFKVIVKDKNGKVLPNANVNVDMYEHEFEWGTAINLPILNDTNYQKGLSENFNTVVLENHAKWNYYDKDPELTKQLLQNAVDLGIKNLRGHTLLWDGVWREGNSSQPEDIRSLHNDKEALQKRIKGHIDEITSDLKPYIKYEWDVLNEAVTNHTIQDIYGREIVKEWYDMAREALGEDGILYYNDFRKEDAYYDMIDEFFENGTDIDGIGIQSHFGSPENPETIYERYNKMSKNGNRLKVTEYDFSTSNNELQANFTRDLMIVSFSHEKIDGFIMWGFRGGSANKYVLYDDNYNPKKGLAIWQDLIYNKWWTNEKGTTNTNGELSVSGYYGDYEITASANGTTKKVTAKLYKNTDNTVIITLD